MLLFHSQVLTPKEKENRETTTKCQPLQNWKSYQIYLRVTEAHNQFKMAINYSILVAFDKQ